MALKSQYKWTATQVLHAADFYTVQRELHLLLYKFRSLAGGSMFPLVLTSAHAKVLFGCGPENTAWARQRPRRPISSAKGSDATAWARQHSPSHNQTIPNTTKAIRHQIFKEWMRIHGGILYLHSGENRDLKLFWKQKCIYLNTKIWNGQGEETAAVWLQLATVHIIEIRVLLRCVQLM
jgi:hypothetical protein